MVDTPDPATPWWRRYAADFVLVVVGVLTALVLEQLVQDWQERERFAATLAALDREVADIASVMAVRLAASPCIERKLDAFSAALDAPLLTAYTDVGRPPMFYASQAAWSGDAPEMLSRHRGAATMGTYGEIHLGNREYIVLAVREQELWTQLRTFESRPEPVDPSRIWRLREAIAGARNANALLTSLAGQISERAEALLGPMPPDPYVHRILEQPLCAPLQPADA